MTEKPTPTQLAVHISLLLMVLFQLSGCGVSKTKTWEILDRSHLGHIQAGWSFDTLKTELTLENEISIESNALPEAEADDLDPGVSPRADVILYKNTPNELHINIDENGKLIRAKTCDPQGDWVTTQGVKVGTSLNTIETINGRAINILGWGWDFGGHFSSNNGGLYLGPHIEFERPDAMKDNFLGDGEFSSDELPNKDQITVACMHINLTPKPDPINLQSQ